MILKLKEIRTLTKNHIEEITHPEYCTFRSDIHILNTSV